jgi:hypothetical protein
MPLLGHAAVCMWWDIAPQDRREFEDWHSHEHFPERVGIPGFRRATRWASEPDAGGFFVMYELEGHETLASPDYFARLNAPTPWSVKMMPRHIGMVRSQCVVWASCGAGLGGSLLTIRLSPAPGHDEALRAELQQRLQALPARAGLTAAHLLKTQAPAAAVTTEQKLRGGVDRAADWVVLVGGYDAQALHDLAAGDLSATVLTAAGALPGQTAGFYRLSYTLTPGDV